jgi:Zn-dependent protease
MSPTRPGGVLHLFRLFGINVYLHWTWFILVYVAVQSQYRTYSSKLWNVLELVAVFAIIVLHEFGHALACRSVGGRADRIVLWPLGGVAFVQPPVRPGAVLWSIAAGPLVNVILALPLIFVAAAVRGTWGTGSDLQQFVMIIAGANILILCFNLLPIYPLDGGQILQSLLWFILGRALSLRIVAVMGMLAAVAGGVAAVWYGEYIFLFMAVFIGWQSLDGYRVARYLAAQKR